MTGSTPPWIPTDPPDEPTSAGDLEKTRDRPRAGEPAAPGSFDGRARSFRQHQASRKNVRRERIGTVLVVVIIALGVYTIVTARPYSPSSSNPFPTPGPPITVTFGSPSSVTAMSCGGGGTAYVERIPWNGSSQPVTTGEVNVRVYEIYDGDFITDINAVANVTSSNLCAGTPPTSSELWYAVLAGPNGTNVLSFTEARPWRAVSSGASDIVIENGSALVLVTSMSLAGTGRGFAVVGYSGGSPIRGTVPR